MNPVYKDGIIIIENGKEIGEIYPIYEDYNSWGCLYYSSDTGADGIDTKEEALEWLKDLANEYKQDMELKC